MKVKKINVRVWDVESNLGRVRATSEYVKEDIYSISAPLAWINRQFNSMEGQAQTKQGHWAMQELLMHPLND